MFTGGDELAPAIVGGDGEHLDILADDTPSTGEGPLFVEGALEARQLLVFVVAVDGDLGDELVQIGDTALSGHEYECSRIEGASASG